VVGAVEGLVYTDVQGKRRERAGRLRLEPIADASGMALGAFLTHHVEGGSKVRTDGWRGYSESALEEYTHHVRVVGDPSQAPRRFPHIHRVFSNLKAWLNGTHHGVEPKHLPSDLDEFVFRFNRRKTPMAAFQTLLEISAQKSPHFSHRIDVTGVKVISTYTYLSALVLMWPRSDSIRTSRELSRVRLLRVIL
jgi:hypothetical protein